MKSLVFIVLSGFSVLAFANVYQDYGLKNPKQTNANYQNDAQELTQEAMHRAQARDNAMTRTVKSLKSKEDIVRTYQKNADTLAHQAVKRAKTRAKAADIRALYERQQAILHKAFPKQTVMKQVPIHVFVSLSMPKKQLQSWFRSTQRVGGTMVLRGFVNGSLKQSVQAITAIVGKVRGGLAIDPKAFTRYHIKRVPAVVIDPEGRGEHYDVLYGQSGLGHALTVMAQEGDVSQTIAEVGLTKLGWTSGV